MGGFRLVGKNVALGVDDLDAAVNLYTEVLGFTLVDRNEMYAQVDAGETTFWLTEDEVREPAFELVVEDVETALETLQENGFTVDEEMSETSGQTFVRDPDGYVFNVFKRSS